MSEHNHSHLRTYLTVFVVLCICTLISVAADVVHFASHSVVVVVVMAVAVTKALCVMMYFMHLKFERAWKYLLLAPTIILASAIPFALAPDVGMHYYTVDVPQLHEFERKPMEGAEQHGHPIPGADVHPQH
jgi:cytochrome c oxidase subunit 4